MIKMLNNLDASALEAELNDLGPSTQVLSIYAINQKHFAWVRVGAPTSPQPEASAKTTKGKK